MDVDLRREFMEPSDEFTPIPFWFWNDSLTERKIAAQVADFKDKGVMGFVIHPRLGLPKDIEYLSDEFMKYVSFAVEEAKKQNMKVVLYDEAMYPSGSAHGLVVKENPTYATRALRMVKDSNIPQLEEKEKLLCIVICEETEDGRLISDTARVITKEEYQAGKQESAYFLIETYSEGTIRGVHVGEDDLEEAAPPSADLLSYEAMAAFIRITYDRYYDTLKEYFGDTIIGMFTDEPCVLGRCGKENVFPWTDGFEKDWMENNGQLLELIQLWVDTENGSHDCIRQKFSRVVYQRMKDSYYRQLSEWCITHEIALTGHPEKSDDIGVLSYFQIPGQDIVWRYVSPDDDTKLVGVHSTLGKCSSDAARHYGRRRNSNECFGCCSRQPYNWSFTVDDMKWYMDWLFVRGVNLLYPHAFFYSVDSEVQFSERPPDVGPNNVFWDDYSIISNYIKRMSQLMTDSYNTTSIAILCEHSHLPWEPAKELFENQIEFNYLEEDLLLSSECNCKNGTIQIEKQAYKVILADLRVVAAKPEIKKKLVEFSENGGKVLYWNKETALADKLSLWREIRIAAIADTKDIRVSHVVKREHDFYLLINEGDVDVMSVVHIPYAALQGDVNAYKAEIWDAWRGTQEQAEIVETEAGIELPVTLKRRESRIIFIRKKAVIDISDRFELGDWCKKEELKNYSGSIAYETEVFLKDIEEQVELDLGRVCEIARVSVNGSYVGAKMWSPYRFDITHAIKENNNCIRIEVANTPANQYEQAELISGLLGPVRIIGAKA